MTKLSRRDFLKITAIAGGLVAGGALLDRGTMFTAKETRRLMGTTVSLTVVSRDQAQTQLALAAAFTEMERLIAIFDHRNTASPLFKLNQTGILHQPPVELVQVFQQAKDISDLSGGAFDVTVKPLVEARRTSPDIDPSLISLVDYRNVSIDPAQIRFAHPGMAATFDGIAKGSVVDGAVLALKAAGCQDVLVEAGGDLALSGRPAGASGWEIGVTHPRSTDAAPFLAAFTLGSGSAATSGDYYQPLTTDLSQHHITDPRYGGSSPAELCSVTVVAPNAATADGLATAIMVLGMEPGLALANSLDGVEALVVTKELLIRRTSGFPTLG